MNGKTFTLILAFIGFGLMTNAQINTGTGTGWGGLFASEPLVLEDNFTGYPFFHSDATADEGNSNNIIDPITEAVIYGYKDTTFNVPFIGSETVNAVYECYQCAFAPEWQTAYALKYETENTANVSNGFLEVSRTYGSTPPTVHGYFIVDLRALSFVDIIQWTHSSCGGNKRGVMLEFSTDDGTTWDTLRYQPAGGAWEDSFTKDIATGVKTSNGFNCEPSAYGMVWEDGIWASNIILRFGEAGGQVPRIHDLKVYGAFGSENAVNNVANNSLKIFNYNRQVRISEYADVSIYNITGKLVLSRSNSNLVSIADLPDGIYIVNAKTANQIKTIKILNK